MSVQTKKEKIVSVRMSEDDFELLQYASYNLGLTPSKYIRMLADTTINPIKIKIKQGAISYEDIKTVCNNKL